MALILVLIDTFHPEAVVNRFLFPIWSFSFCCNSLWLLSLNPNQEKNTNFSFIT